MFFNDRRQSANARALKKAQGPSLASGKNFVKSMKNRAERHEIRLDAEYMQPHAVSRKERYAKSTQTVEQNIRRTGNPQGKKK